jgi:hypothetical protein
MSNWHPKPLRPQDPNPLFDMDDESYVVKSMTPLQRQRAADGTLHSNKRRDGLAPPSVPNVDGETFYIQSDGAEEGVQKSRHPQESIDVRAVLKAFFEKGEKPYQDEEEEKGVAESIGGAAKTAVNTAISTASQLGNQQR